ncbi:hypothetical protein CBS63078_325 [Aspergillus niger]|nr:hypothetical protein CBS115989_8846 [Aspergillus niger]KAI2825278.1 hypothetical protein CBS133816_8672 [Aspergillus niger]KAI2836310.1 hypothetical protein CBS11350_9437 [Aspergillus niger]KAI2843212.1 hypothetical protein CBS11232_8325 [Aspergillus niger]KAI2874796.1 hypothetical protein CBS115988_5997 [Aspergillus niger]
MDESFNLPWVELMLIVGYGMPCLKVIELAAQYFATWFLVSFTSSTDKMPPFQIVAQCLFRCFQTGFAPSIEMKEPDVYEFIAFI